MRNLQRIVATFLGVFTLFVVSAGVFGGDIYTSHGVTKGDTVYNIARSYGVTMDAVVNANGLSHDGTTIYPGMVLIIDANAKNTAGANYTVKSGDSLFRIGANYGISAAALKSQNGLSADRIYVGQKLKVDDSVSTFTSSISEDDLYMMAKMIYGEARGESYEGQVAVGAVIMNRIKSSSFPNTMSGVLFQKNQFSAVDDGQYDMTPDAAAIRAAQEAAGGADPSNGALFYWNPVKAPNNSFLNAKPIITTIGSHVFA